MNSSNKGRPPIDFKQTQTKEEGGSTPEGSLWAAVLLLLIDDVSDYINGKPMSAAEKCQGKFSSRYQVMTNINSEWFSTICDNAGVDTDSCYFYIVNLLDRKH